CGAMIVITVAGHAAYPFGAFDDEGRRLGANSLLMWQVAQDLASEGVGDLDLGPSALGSGAYRFKSHMGGGPQTLHYVDLVQRGPTGNVAAPSVPRASASLGRLDRVIESLPFALRMRARMWLGGTGRLL